ncbi:MAG: outer membrane beta-barrel protein [Bacteroidia bacterium]
MKRLALLFVSLCFVFGGMFGQLSLLPQVGLNLTRYNTDPPPFVQTARVGLDFGGQVRIGGQFYVQPGIAFMRQQVELEEIRFPLPPIPNRDQINQNSLMLNALIGYNLIYSDAFCFRINAGPTATWVTAVSTNKLNLTKSNFNSIQYGARAGLGIDIAVFTFDLNYDHGLNNSLIDTESKVRMLSANVGLKFTFD